MRFKCITWLIFMSAMVACADHVKYSASTQLDVDNNNNLNNSKEDESTEGKYELWDLNRDGLDDKQDRDIFMIMFDRYATGCVNNDTNCDGKVDENDRDQFNDTFAVTRYKIGDLDGNGKVDYFDYEKFKLNPSLLSDYLK